MKTRKIAIITGSRGEYGYIRPIIKLIHDDFDLDYDLIVTNMHLLEEFGLPINEIKKDEFKISATHYMALDGYNNITMVKSLGVLLMSLPETIDRLKPDIILLAGDRGEQLIGALVGASMNIPVVHIQAGEVSGNIDGITRHAITKFSHIHLVSNQDAYDRVRKMGEDEYRIYITGAPQLDELSSGEYTNEEELITKYSINKKEPLIIVVQHSVTEEFDDAMKQMEETMKAVNKIDKQCIIINPNCDAGNTEIKKSIYDYITNKMKIYKNLPRQDYLGLLKISSVIVGNSSSGIIEAPFFGIPTINIGNRQMGRFQGSNVINVNHNHNEIYRAIKKSIGRKFDGDSPYGDGKSSKRIVNILKNVNIDNKLINKRISY